MAPSRNPLLTSLKKICLFTQEIANAFVEAFVSLDHSRIIVDEALINGLYGLSLAMTQAKISLFFKFRRYTADNQANQNTTVNHVATFIGTIEYNEPAIPLRPGSDVPTTVGGATSTTNTGNPDNASVHATAPKAHFDRMSVGAV